jgi:hypothetical protein
VVEDWRCTVPYGCKLEDLLAILHDRAPAKADAVALQRRCVEHGLLSVGLNTTLADLFAPLFVANPFSAMRASLR